MTPLELQHALRRELETLFPEECYAPADDSGELRKISVFEQQLPEPPEDEDEPAPYIIVRLLKGEIDDPDSPHRVSVVLIICIRDDTEENSGHAAVMNVIDKITHRFLREPLLDRRYEAVLPLNWALQDEDTAPYYIGGVEMSFEIPAVRREDYLA